MKKGLRRMYLAFLSPVVIAFLIAYLYPVLRTVQMSFFEVSDISAARDTWEFVGLYNYVDLFSRQLFRVSFKNMMLIFLAGGAAVFLISLFFAWVLHKGMFMGNLWRNLIYLPTVITPVAMITVWTQYAYNSRYGLLKTVFETLGLDGLAAIPWTSTQYAFWSMLIAFCFCSIGGNLLVYMAAMKKIPDDLFEAAFMDGATEGKIFFRITLPLIADNVKTQFTFWTIGCIGFFLWSRVFSVVPSDPTTITPASYMYDQIFGTSISSNAVASGTNVGMGAAIAATVIRSSRRKNTRCKEDGPYAKISVFLPAAEKPSRRPRQRLGGKGSARSGQGPYPVLVRLHGRAHRLGGAGVLHAHPGHLPKRPAGRRAGPERL